MPGSIAMPSFFTHFICKRPSSIHLGIWHGVLLSFALYGVCVVLCVGCYLLS
eukprot:c37661_g1_i1 orf=1-153(-)